jgi:hypothetical protein
VQTGSGPPGCARALARRGYHPAQIGRVQARERQPILSTLADRLDGGTFVPVAAEQHDRHARVRPSEPTDVGGVVRRVFEQAAAHRAVAREHRRRFVNRVHVDRFVSFAERLSDVTARRRLQTHDRDLARRFLVGMFRRIDGGRATAVLAQCLAQGFCQLVAIPWLLDHVDLRVARFLVPLELLAAGHQKANRVGLQLLELVDEHHAIHAGHAQIRGDHRIRKMRCQLPSLVAVPRQIDDESALPHRSRKRSTRYRIIIHEQYAF